jgi:hypothetical protein
MDGVRRGTDREPERIRRVRLGQPAVHGPGTYPSSSAFTPRAAGKYWWYATYNGDATDAPAHSACGASMAATTVTS